MGESNSDWPLTTVTVTVVLASMAGLSILAGGQSVSIGSHSGLVVCAALALGVQWACWIPASLRQTERYYDLTGGITSLCAVVLSLWAGSQEHPPTIREWLLSGMVCLWALRLASFLFLRIHRAGKDRRFDRLKTSPVRFLVPWTLQGLWVFLTLLVVLVINCQATNGPPMGPWDYLGVTLWVLGFGIEVIADRQKSAFAARAGTEGTWIDEGLWSLSRHPNYFGEILLWSGIALCGVSCFSGGEWAALVSPFFVALLLTKISGVPMLDERAMKRWGDNPDYLAYRARTRMLLPLRRSSGPLVHTTLVLGLVASITACAPGLATPFSLEDCERTCGDGPLYLFDQLEFIVEQDDGLDGFDLDDQSEDCGVEDATSPEGATGIDNQLGAIWDVLPDTVATVLPTAIDTSLESGTMMVVMELVGPPDFSVDGPAVLVFRQGAGQVLVSSTGRPLSGQTADLASEDNLLGLTDQVDINGGLLEGTELSLTFRLQYLDTDVELTVVRGKVQIIEESDGGLQMRLGGVVPLDSVMDIVAGLGGAGDANLAATLEALLPLLVDARTDPAGECDGISGAFRGHAVPVHLF